jgi:hypothetical protein
MAENGEKTTTYIRTRPSRKNSTFLKAKENGILTFKINQDIGKSYIK